VQRLMNRHKQVHAVATRYGKLSDRYQATTPGQSMHLRLWPFQPQ
jgi:hypothetical protein